VQSVRREFQARELAKSERLMRQRYQDAEVKPDDALAAFGAAVQQNPALANEMLIADDAGEFAYEAGKNLLLLSQSGGSLTALIQREREKARAEALAEIQKTRPVTDDIPESLSKVTGRPSADEDEPINLPLASIIRKR
jgi:hypothetical protein